MTSEKITQTRLRILELLKRLGIITPKSVAEYENDFLNKGLFPNNWVKSIASSLKISAQVKEDIFNLSKEAIDINIPPPKKPLETKYYRECNPTANSEMTNGIGVISEKKHRVDRRTKMQSNIPLPPPKTQRPICSNYKLREMAYSVLSDVVKRTSESNNELLSLVKLNKNLGKITTEYQIEIECKSTLLMIDKKGIVFASYDVTAFKIIS